MTSSTSLPSIWVRIIDRISKIDEAVNFDNTQNTIDRITVLQQELMTLNARVAQLETDLPQNPGDNNSQVAA